MFRYFLLGPPTRRRSRPRPTSHTNQTGRMDHLTDPSLALPLLRGTPRPHPGGTRTLVVN